jgi:hypothetical protein
MRQTPWKVTTEKLIALPTGQNCARQSGNALMVSNYTAKSDLPAKHQSKPKKESESFNFADTNAD